MKTERLIDMREAIIASATNTVMTDGYNALSFRNIADEVGIKHASIHYHFKTKGDLAQTLVTRFREDLVKKLEPLADLPFEEAMDGYIAVFRAAFVDRNRMCLAGMMSAEITALPQAACDEISTFAETHREFLRATLAKKHTRMPIDQLDARAGAIFAAMEGAQLVTRGLGGDVEKFDGFVDTYRKSGLLG